MKSDWKIKTLGDLFDITSSKRVFESDWKREGVPFYRAREIVKLAQQGFVDNELFISEEMFSRYSTKYGVPDEGDIMVTGVGTLGICHVVQKRDRFYFKDGNIIWLKKKSEVDSRFVEYAFKSDFLRMQIDDSVGATVGTFTIVKAKNTKIPVPPLPEQKRIVGILDEAFEGIATAKANADKNLQNARALFESHLQSVFSQRGPGWDVAPLVSLCSIFIDSAHRTPTYQPEGVPALRPRDVVNGDLDFTNSAKVSKEEYEIQSRRHRPAHGDIVYSRELSYGWAAALPREPHVCLSQGMCLFRTRTGVDTAFLVYFLNSSFGREQALRAAVGAAHPHINLSDIKGYQIPFPSYGEQKRISAQLDALHGRIRRLTYIYEKKATLLNLLKKAVLREAFTGNV